MARRFLLVMVFKKHMVSHTHRPLVHCHYFVGPKALWALEVDRIKVEKGMQYVDEARIYALEYGRFCGRHFFLDGTSCRRPCFIA